MDRRRARGVFYSRPQGERRKSKKPPVPLRQRYTVTCNVGSGGQRFAVEFNREPVS